MACRGPGSVDAGGDRADRAAVVGRVGGHQAAGDGDGAAEDVDAAAVPECGVGAYEAVAEGGGAGVVQTAALGAGGGELVSGQGAGVEREGGEVHDAPAEVR